MSERRCVACRLKEKTGKTATRADLLDAIYEFLPDPVARPGTRHFRNGAGGNFRRPGARRNGQAAVLRTFCSALQSGSGSAATRGPGSKSRSSRAACSPSKPSPVLIASVNSDHVGAEAGDLRVIGRAQVCLQCGAFSLCYCPWPRQARLRRSGAVIWLSRTRLWYWCPSKPGRARPRKELEQFRTQLPKPVLQRNFRDCVLGCLGRPHHV